MSNFVTQAVFNLFVNSYNENQKSKNQEIVNLRRDIEVLKKRQKHIEDNFAGLYDMFYAHDKIGRMKSISVEGFYEYLKENNFNINNEELKNIFQLLISYFNLSNKEDTKKVAQLMVEAFRVRNSLIELPIGDIPVLGDLAVISLDITYSNSSKKNLDWIVYQIGTNTLGIDSALIGAKIGESFERNIKDEQTGDMNKCIITVHSFNRKIKNGGLQEVSEEQKKKDWNNKFQSHEIK